MKTYAIVLALVLTPGSFGFTLDAFDLLKLRNDLAIRGDNLEGTLQKGKQWKGFVCDGFYDFRTTVKGRISDLKIEMDKEGQLDVYVDIRELRGTVQGAYASELSLCSRVWGTYPYGVDRFEANAHVSFVDVEGSQVPEMKLRVQRTRFSKIRVDVTGLFGWFEDVLTTVVNVAAERVWASRLGEWISEWVSEELKKKIPTNRIGDHTDTP